MKIYKLVDKHGNFFEEGYGFVKHGGTYFTNKRRAHGYKRACENSSNLDHRRPFRVESYER